MPIQHRHLRTLTQLSSCLIASAFLASGAWVWKADRELLQRIGPTEGYYWSAVQYQLAYLRARELVRASAMGDQSMDDEVARRLAVLNSKRAVLMAPSELTSTFSNIPGYKSSIAAISAFHRQIDGIAVDSSTRSRRDLLEEFNTVNDVVSDMANEARSAEIAERGAVSAGLLWTRKMLWLAMCTSLVFAVLTMAAMLIAWLRQKEVADARDRALELEQASVRKNAEFLGMVSHELKSPLQSIVSALDVLEMRNELPNNGEITGRIRRAANELGAQLRDMLTVARGREGYLSLSPHAFEVNEMIAEVVSCAQHEARSMSKRFELHLLDSPAFVVADSVRIGQLLHNLAINAVRYSERGHVAVRLVRVDVSAGLLEISVSDTGPGLPEHALETLQLGKPAIPIAGRRGIGLTVVRSLTQVLDAKLTINARRGCGTEFLISIPVTQAREVPSMER